MNAKVLLSTLALCAAAGLQPATANDFSVVDVPAEATVDVYFEINLSGQVYLNIRDREGPACANLWWIVWPLGTISDLGEKCGSVHLDIPGLSRFAISSKLRARGGSMPTKIGVAANERVANSITFTFP
jgi:hypothetical protein